MKKYIAMHTYTVDPPKVWKLLGDVASEMAIEMATGKLPANVSRPGIPSPTAAQTISSASGKRRSLRIS